VKLYPTTTAVQLALAGAAMVAVGVVAGQGTVAGWGIAVLVGVAVARAATLVSVSRIRAAGFEMIWTSSVRRVRASRGIPVVLEAEVRNRDTRAARYVALRPIGSPGIEVTLEPVSGEVPAGGALRVSVKVFPKRVGQHAVFGLSLEVQGSPGLFEVPLSFANPYGIEVMPASYGLHLGAAQGGRSRLRADAGKAGRQRGEGNELRELRERMPGDPFKRIAWRASARRGKLIVREMERDERDIVWLVLDASVEHWSGEPGYAPLDGAIDEAAALVDRHLAQGDQVGLAMIASRRLAVLEPARGPAHGLAIHRSLALAAGTHDADRSDLAEADVALRVFEHLRPVDGKPVSDSLRRDLDRLAQRASGVGAKAPFAFTLAEAPSMRERILRGYLLAFGVDSPPRLEPERMATDRELASFLDELSKKKKKPSLVVILAPAPEIVPEPLASAIRRLGVGKIQWEPLRAESALPLLDDGTPEVRALLSAMTVRTKLHRERGERALRRLGVRLLRVRRRRAPVRPSEGST
jgi:uncharacterized protein (DUF58 family)